MFRRDWGHARGAPGAAAEGAARCCTSPADVEPQRRFLHRGALLRYERRPSMPRPTLPAAPAVPSPSAADGPLAQYRARLQAGEIMPAPAQRLAVDKLQSLWRALQHYKPGNGEGGWRARLGLAPTSDPPPLGLYIFRGVGRRKSMLMDMFFATAPIDRKRPVHFYAFMLEVHEPIHARRGKKGDPIGPVAHALAKQATLLCFDGFQVTDIADAMILGRVFTPRFEAGAVVVATSHRPPYELYKDGLQRERFLPFIALLKEK